MTSPVILIILFLLSSLLSSARLHAGEVVYLQRQGESPAPQNRPLPLCDVVLANKAIYEHLFRLAQSAGLDPEIARVFEVKVRKLKRPDLVSDFVDILRKNITHLNRIDDDNLFSAVSGLIYRDIESINLAIELNGALDEVGRGRAISAVARSIQSERYLEDFFENIESRTGREMQLFVFFNRLQMANLSIQETIAPQDYIELKETLIRQINFVDETFIARELRRLVAYVNQYSRTSGDQDPEAFGDLLDVAFAVTFLFTEVKSAVYRVQSKSPELRTKSPMASDDLLEEMVLNIISNPASHKALFERVKTFIALHYDDLLATRSEIIYGINRDAEFYARLHSQLQTDSRSALLDLASLP